MNHSNTHTLCARPSIVLLLVSLTTGYSQPTFQFTARSYSVGESDGVVMIAVQRQGDLTTAVSVDYATTGGIVANGLKYTPVLGTLVFGPGETNRPITVPILNDGLVDGQKVFTVLLSNPTGGAILGAPTNATVTIRDNDCGVVFENGTISVAKDAGVVRIAVMRGDDGNLPVSVDFFTTDLTARSGQDYTGTNRTLTFAPHERLKSVTIPILNNPLKVANTTFRVSLIHPTGATLGNTKIITVTIGGYAQGFQFESARYTVTENSGAALIRVLRGTDDISTTTMVDYTTTDDSAIAGRDYTTTKGTLSFAPGEQSKWLAVPILNNGLQDTIRAFRLTLSNATSGSTLGALSTTSVSILDNDSGVGFDLYNYTNCWGQTMVKLPVLRGNDSTLEPFSVDFTTSDGTAKAGQEYQAVSGTLQFQKNETVKILSIPLLTNRVVGTPKGFRVTLSNPTPWTAMGKATANVYVFGAYCPVAPAFDAALTIQRTAGVNMLTWIGGGQLHKAENLTGPWQTLANIKSPYPIQPPTQDTFYRVTAPRPVNLYIPSGYDGKNPVPLVLLLHMWTNTGPKQENYMHFQPLAESQGFLYCYPDGVADHWGQFWNATDACCDYEHTGVDDAGYLRSLIEEIERQFAVDRKRVYLIGHSNGAFMAHRMACEAADLIAGIASLAGNPFLDSERYVPAEPVNILQIQGTADTEVHYEGGAFVMNPINTPPYPSAIRTIQMWADYNGASDPITDAAPSMHLVANLTGLDTVITRYAKCPPGGSVELWTMNGAGHIPQFSSQFAPRVIDWLLAHPKP